MRRRRKRSRRRRRTRRRNIYIELHRKYRYQNTCKSITKTFTE